MIPFIRKKLAVNSLNRSGWKTSKKLIVIESDDWGSIRMPNKHAFEALRKIGVKVETNPYCLYDQIETANDLACLYDVLKKHKDANGRHPVITANTVMANPDFAKIRAHHFQQYFYEPFTDTLNKQNNPINCFELYQQGIQQEIFFPQFHGREHVNVAFWLSLLQQNHQQIHAAFDVEMWGLPNEIQAKSIQATFDYHHANELEFLAQSVDEGLAIFQSVFGFNSASFIANNFIWPSALNSNLINNGVKYMQGMKYQLLPKENGTKQREMIRRISGENLDGLINIVRNVQFEPSFLLGEDRTPALANSLGEIANAFFWKKPAVISMHRLNFSGSLSEENRTTNLNLLDRLFSEILKKWPDAIFCTSVDVGKMMVED